MVSDSEPSIFLQWVGLVSNSIGATPTRPPSLKVFGLARLAGLFVLRLEWTNIASTKGKLYGTVSNSVLTF